MGVILATSLRGSVTLDASLVRIAEALGLDSNPGGSMKVTLDGDVSGLYKFLFDDGEVRIARKREDKDDKRASVTEEVEQ